MSLACPYCEKPVPQSAIDQARQIAHCSGCGRVIDLLRVSAAPQAAQFREPIALPAGMGMRKWWPGRVGEGVGGLEITRRWLRSKHFVLLAIGAAGAAGVAYAWQTDVEPRAMVTVATIAVCSFAIQLIPMFVNSTKIRVTREQVEVRHGPLPSLFFRNQTVATTELKQLFVARFGGLFEVAGELADGSRVPLVRPVVSEEQGLFIEQTIEQYLGIIDVPVDAELDGPKLPAEAPAAVSAGAGAAMSLLPLGLIALMFVLMSVMTASTLEGSFTLKGDLGDATFTPDDCRSGQQLGFNGAQLSSKTAPFVVRVMRDPTQGALIAVEGAGQKPVVVSPEGCKVLSVSVQRNNTNVNDVWGVVGSATADCPNLVGTIKFDGCY